MFKFNLLPVYAEAGRKAGEARNQHDESRAKFHSDWMRRAVAIEHREYQPLARKAFDDAYKAARTI